MIPVEIENTRLKLALNIPTGAPMTVSNEKQLITCQNSQKKQYIS